MLNIKKRVIAAISSLFFLVMGLCGAANAAKTFVIDTDVGVDDVIAILYLLQRPDIDIKAITIASAGNAHCVPAFRNIQGILKMMGKSNIPVDCGLSKSLHGQHRFPPAILEEADVLSGASKLLPKIDSVPQQKGVELLISTIQQSKQPVTILAIGPLTNIASALQRAPDIKSRIQGIYIMGGAVEVPGNLSDAGVKINNKVAEWNIYLDPIAAAIVFNQNIPITLVPLDVTNSVPVDASFADRMKKLNRNPVSNLINTMINNNQKMITAKQWYFWDPLSAVVASDESIATFKTQPLSVILAPESQSGRTLLDPATGQSIRVVDKVDLNRFKDMLSVGLNGGKETTTKIRVATKHKTKHTTKHTKKHAAKYAAKHKGVRKHRVHNA